MRLAPDRRTFDRLAATGTVPVVATFLADALSPVTAYAALAAEDPSACLLESVEVGERWGRYSVVATGGRLRLRARFEAGAAPGAPPRLSVDVPGTARGFEGLSDLPPLAAIRTVQRALAAAEGIGGVLPDLPRFWGGLLGAFGHDFVRLAERLPRPAPDVEAPVFDLAATDLAVVFDNLTGLLHLVVPASLRLDGDGAFGAAVERIERAADRLRAAGGVDLAPLPEPGGAPPLFGARRCTEREAYRHAVARARGHIAAGDVFQVVLAQAFEAEAPGCTALDLYRVLRVTNPAPYMFVVPTFGPTLVGASPEVLVRVDAPDRGGTVVLRPIAGTRPRGATPEEDARLEAELLADPKERAEHTMLVDLARNDVGRVARAGSVEVTARFTVERYARVMHIVSEVRGILAPGATALDALVAAFPAGTLSGAPKVRALELVDALEAGPRGFYGGAVGYLGYDGAADFAIAIRTAEVEGARVRVRAGAGIVADSDPAAEDAECCNKASALLAAVDLARALRSSGANGGAA